MVTALAVPKPNAVEFDGGKQGKSYGAKTRAASSNAGARQGRQSSAGNGDGQGVGDGFDAIVPAQFEGSVDRHHDGLDARALVAHVVEGVLTGDDGGPDLPFGSVVVGRHVGVIEEGEQRFAILNQAFDRAGGVCVFVDAVAQLIEALVNAGAFGGVVRSVAVRASCQAQGVAHEAFEGFGEDEPFVAGVFFGDLLDLAQQVGHTNLAPLGQQPVVGAEEVADHRAGESLAKELQKNGGRAAFINEIVGQVRMSEAPQPVSLAVDAPAGEQAHLLSLVGVKDGAVFGLGGEFKYIPYVRANRHRRKYEDWNAAQLFLTVAEFLQDNAERRSNRYDPFLLWVDCFDPHEPWDIPPEYARMYDKDPNYDGVIDPRAFENWKDPDMPQTAKDRIAAWYAGKVSWVDRWFGEAMLALEETGLGKNTAVIVTADHGTNVGERGIFSKDTVIREQEAHVPLIIHVPGRGAGRSEMWVQPQDIFNTVMRIADAQTPKGVQESYDVLSAAERGAATPREFAISGQSAHTWERAERPVKFTVFDEEWYLLVGLKPEQSQLYRYGCLPNVVKDHPDVAARLREQGLGEMLRRGATPELVEWLRSEGCQPFPSFPSVRRVEPEGWSSYWGRNYQKWQGESSDPLCCSLPSGD